MIGIAAIGLDLGTAGALALGAVSFAVALGTFVTWGRRQIARYRVELDVLFPSQVTRDAPG